MYCGVDDIFTRYSVALGNKIKDKWNSLSISSVNCTTLIFFKSHNAQESGTGN